jgi:hypothetical protein
MKILNASALVFSILAFRATGWSAPRPDPEGDSLRLRNGSLLESIHFRNAWLKEHPDEDAIIVPKETARDGQIHVAATCAYTKRGAVLVHGPDGGAVSLPGARPEILNEPVRLAAACRGIGGDIGHDEDGEAEAQIARACAALSDRDVMGLFPVAVSKLASRVSAPGGATVREDADWLVFDWNGGHYGYHPDVGVIRQPVPVDPLTSRPYLGVALGDLVESVIFCAEYRKAHPDEKAALLFFPRDPRRGENTGGTAAAAFTRKGSLYFHSVFFGDIDLTENGRAFVPMDLADPARLYRAYESYLWRRFADACKAKGIATPDPRSLHRGGREIADILGTRIPAELAGDTPDLQVRRAFQRAQALGLSSEVGMEARPDEPGARETCLVLCWNVSEYVYAPSRGGHYGVETDTTALPNRLIDGVLFASRRRRDHPDEKALAIPYRESGSDKWKAVTVYSKGSEVWLHNPETGETPFPAYSPRDLENPAKFKSIRTDGNKLIKNAAILGIKKKSAKLNELPIDREADTGALEPSAVCAQMQEAGIPCRILGNARERDAAGTFRDYPSPALTFEWWGVTYTYGPEHYCTASNGFVSTP